jgi:hypothetical protein
MEKQASLTPETEKGERPVEPLLPVPASFFGIRPFAALYASPASFALSQTRQATTAAVRLDAVGTAGSALWLGLRQL